MPKANRRYRPLVNFGRRDAVCARAASAVADRHKARTIDMKGKESVEQAIAKVDVVVAMSHGTRLTCDHYQDDSYDEAREDSPYGAKGASTPL